MSDYAITEYDDEPMTAWDYRNLYLWNGIKYANFNCPFCGIRLCANLIYTDGEISKSPYFSAKWGGHIADCNGEPILVEKAENEPPKAHYDLREMSFPEALINRPPPRKTRQNEPRPIVSCPSPAEILERRKKAGLLGRPVPSTYLLQPIVETYNGVWKEGYEKAKANKWGDEERQNWTMGALREKPLRLADKTNYSDAFRRPTYLNRGSPRIYYDDGLVIPIQDGFIITSKKQPKINEAQVPFRVVINVALVNDASPKSHVAILSALKGFAASGIEVRWYAYGMPCITDSLCELEIETLDYLYIKKAFQKRQ